MNAALASAYRDALGQIAGRGVYTKSKAKALLSIGLTKGLGRQEGRPLTETGVLGEVMKRRIDQLHDPTNAGSTTFAARGYYAGGKERSVRIEVAWIPDRKENTTRKFFRNIQRLAEDLAGKLAQREILIEWDAPRRRNWFETASPPGAPSPTNRPKFCAWVRQHSRRARTDPRDSCYPRKLP